MNALIWTIYFATAFAVLPLSGAGAQTTRTTNGPDWMLDPKPYRATVRVSPGGKEIVLENGLLRRVLLLTPNAATVSLENLMTGAQLVRSVRPEAEVEIDGTKFAVGGLEGQPVHNYLDPRWLKTMTAIPGSYEFDHAETGVTAARFPWKKRLEWMPQDVPWPPPGKSLTLFFRPPAAPPPALSGPVFLEDHFQGQLKAAWKIHASTSHPRASFANEGKAGEIMAVADTCVFGEQTLPKDAVTIEVVADTGDDTMANSWGPGIALMAGGQPVASLVMRPNSQQYEICTPAIGQQQADHFDRSKPATLRIRLDGDSINFEASQDGKKFVALGHSKLVKKPDALRVGKVGQGGRGEDYSPVNADQTALPPRCHILNVAVRGTEPAAKSIARDDLPSVQIHYEIYDGIPLICKWVTATNSGTKTVRLNSLATEILAVVEPESFVGRPIAWMNLRPDIYIESDYAMAGDGSARVANRVVQWKSDPLYGTQVHYDRQTPCLLECRPEHGPDQDIVPGGSFESYRAFELLLDSSERERSTLAKRKMYRTIAPWVAESPILMHVSGSDDAGVRRAIDQCADVGFQMVIMTFGSGFNYESRDPAYQQRYKALSDYARSKGIALGGYSLLASRGAATDADNTQGAPTAFGVMPCLGAQWGHDYLEQIKTMNKNAGLEAFEHDGSYPGDECAATTHPFHHGLADSRWVMWRATANLYQWCLANGVYTHIPDWWILSGATRTYMGYRETNWSLPREYQEIIERQNIFDGTWDKTPSMGWMFVPLTQYHGGGAAATIEPLQEHLPHYEQRFANLFGAGVQACYRGPRLYDSEATKQLVKKWVGFYKKHRAILDSDIIHLRRADGRQLDYILHVNPALPEKGLLMVYNPTTQAVQQELTLPLYYTGLTKSAHIREQEGPAKSYALSRDYSVKVPVNIPANGYSWFVVE